MILKRLTRVITPGNGIIPYTVSRILKQAQLGLSLHLHMIAAEIHSVI